MMNRKDISIQLTQIDPIERLDEFCAQAKYRGRFYVEEFGTGILCKVTVETYSCFEIITEARYIGSLDEKYVRRVLAAIILDRLGLGIDDRETEKTSISDIMEKIKDMKFPVTKESLNDFTFSALHTLLGEDFLVEEDDEELEPEYVQEDNPCETRSWADIVAKPCRE